MSALVSAAAARSLPLREARAVVAPGGLFDAAASLLQEATRRCAERGQQVEVEDSMQGVCIVVVLAVAQLAADERLAGDMAAWLRRVGRSAVPGRQTAAGPEAGAGTEQPARSQTPTHGSFTWALQHWSVSAAAAIPQLLRYMGDDVEQTPVARGGTYDRADGSRNTAAVAVSSAGHMGLLLGAEGAARAMLGGGPLDGLGPKWRDWAGMDDAEAEGDDGGGGDEGGLCPLRWLPRLLRQCANPGCRNFGGAAEADLPLRQCAGCQAVRYCGAECQQVHWRAGHKAECAQLRAAAGQGAGPNAGASG